MRRRYLSGAYAVKKAAAKAVEQLTEQSEAGCIG